MSDQNKRIDRRTFLKALGAAGATTAFTTVAAQASSYIGYVPSQMPMNEDAPPGMKAVYLYSVGPGGNFDWKAGDSLKFLPAEKIPAGKAADTLAALPKDKLLDLYRSMFTTRKWETSLKDGFLKQETYGSYSLYIGEEAIASGVIAALNGDDYVVSTHRPGGHLISKGIDLNKYTAEVYLRATGASKGKGARMHVADPSKGILGSNGIVGAAWYPAAGAAYGIKVRGTKQVAVGFGGDNAANSIYYFSAVRNAALWKLPVIFVVENNFQAIQIPMAATVPTKQISDYTKGLDIPSVTVDGNDVAAVYAAAKEAADRARAGKGPSVIEGMTYRWYDHHGFAGASIGQEGAFKLPYRTDDEVRQWMARDPILRFKTFLLEKKLVAEADLTKLEADVLKAVEAAYDFARKSPFPDPKAGLQDVFAEGSVPATQFYAAQ